jgi:HSP20 family molecular chaperone IbpA
MLSHYTLRGRNMRRNRRNNPNDIFGIDELLESWLDMMSMASQLEQAYQPTTKKTKQNPMSYEDRDKDIVFTIDMPGVSKKDIDIEVEDHFIKVSATNGNGRDYNYTRRFKPLVDVDSAKATFTNGVLDITVNKVAEKKGKQVKIK